TPFGAVEDDGGEFDAFPTESSGRSEGSGSGYGNVSLDEGLGGSLADAVGLGADVDRGPVHPAAAASAQVVLPEAGAVVPTVKTPKSGLSKGARIAIGGVLVLAIGGGALGAVLPEVGPYGAY